MNGRLLLLLGPSGVGKSSVIQILLGIDSRFRYISPYMTRLLRPGETDKVPVTESEMERMAAAGELLALNELYGIKYGTPRVSIDQHLDSGNFPLLDWPLDRLALMEEAFRGRLFSCYLAPPSLEVLRGRLVGRENLPARVAAAEAEQQLADTSRGRFDLYLVSHDGGLNAVARRIYESYLTGIGSELAPPELRSESSTRRRE